VTIWFSHNLPDRPSLQVSERTKTAEELAELERRRLAALEARRLKRMRADDVADDVADDIGADISASGGYRARRLKRQRGQTRAETGPSGAQFFLISNFCISAAVAPKTVRRRKLEKLDGLEDIGHNLAGKACCWQLLVTIQCMASTGIPACTFDP